MGKAHKEISMRAVLFILTQMGMKQNLLYKWVIAAVMAITSFTSVFADTEITSLDQLKAGVVFHIYPAQRANGRLGALACSGNGESLTNRAEAGDGDEWTLEDAGDGLYYLKNELECYLSSSIYSNSYLCCTTDKASAAKVKLTKGEYNRVIIQNQEDGTGLYISEILGPYYHWGSSSLSEEFNFDLIDNFVEIDGIGYDLNISDKTAEVCISTNLKGDIEVPEFVECNGEKFAVTSLGDDCFYRCNNLTGMTLPNNIKRFGSGCFTDCVSLRNIILPNNIRNLGERCFQNCRSLTSIVLPDNIWAVASSCFKGCSSLTSITFPKSNSVKFFLATECFENCSSLTSITLPDGVTSLGDKCFSGCSKLTSINLPNSVTALGNGCFYHCSSLTSITLSNSITSLPENCFCGCSSLTSITLPDGITSLGADCLEDCSSLTSITLPNSITSLGTNCFYGCCSLTSIDLPNSIISLGYGCFRLCSKLSYIVFPLTLKIIGDDIFYNAMQKKSIVCLAATPPNCPSSNFIDSNTSLFVPNNAIDLYKNTAPWNTAKSIQPIIFTLPNEVSVVKTDSTKLECTVNVEEYHLEGLEWTSSNADVASVDETTGVITAKKVGDAVITATATDGSGISASTTVHVTPLLVSDISLPKEVSITKTDAKKLKYTVSPVAADNQKLKWTSNNAVVASVDENTGEITGLC